MVIAHVLTSLCTGGGERVALMLASEQARAGHRVLVVSFEEPAGGELLAAFEGAGVQVRRVPKRAGFDPGLSLTLSRLFRREQVDVVHTHNPLPLTYAAVAAKTAGARVVHTKHGPHPDRSHRLWLRRLGGLAVDAFVAVSEATAGYARQIREVSSAKLHVVENATDLRSFRPDRRRRAAARRAWGLAEDCLVVGTVGRLAAVKNHQLLVTAVAPLLDERRRLVIAGDGPLRARTEALVAELGLTPWVRLLGNVEDVPTLLCGLDLFVLPSRVEGLPLVLAEAMACGLPVVATAVGGVPRVVRHEHSGLLVAPGDQRALTSAIDALLASTSLRERMGRTGRRLAERHYDSERMTREYMRLYLADGALRG